MTAERLFVSYLGYLWVVLCNDCVSNCEYSFTWNGWLVTIESGATQKKTDMDWLLRRSSSICLDVLSETTNNVGTVVHRPDVWRRQLRHTEQQFTTRLRLSELVLFTSTVMSRPITLFGNGTKMLQVHYSTFILSPAFTFAVSFVNLLVLLYP